jgi:hypothetical protein
MGELNITAESKDGVLTVLEGKALTPREKKPLLISGEINAISKFLACRAVNPKDSHVMFSRSKMILTLYSEDQSELGDKIIGKLVVNPDLEKFAINNQRERSPKELAQFIKMNRIHFLDKEQCSIIVSELNKFSAKITAEIGQSQDTRGNSSAMEEIKVKSNIPEQFKLELPAFVGKQKVSFRVEICIDATSGGVTCWLESVELKELMDSMRDSYIDEEISLIKAQGDFAIIEEA